MASLADARKKPGVRPGGAAAEKPWERNRNTVRRERCPTPAQAQQ